jgi:hypothetical protein
LYVLLFSSGHCIFCPSLFFWSLYFLLQLPAKKEKDRQYNDQKKREGQTIQ